MEETTFEFGDYVVYDNGYKTEIGRVASCNDEKAFVCYHAGCTAASTSKSMLRKATEDEIKSVDVSIGHHRFDEFCPDRVDEACYMCRARVVE